MLPDRLKEHDVACKLRDLIVLLRSDPRSLESYTTTLWIRVRLLSVFFWTLSVDARSEL